MTPAARHRRSASAARVAGLTGAGLVAGAYGFVMGRRRVFPADVVDRLAARRRDRRYRDGPWSIATAACDDPLDLSALADRPRPVLHRGHVTDVDAVFVADPFLVEAPSGELHLLFEVMNRATSRGEIGAATSTDEGTTWSYRGIVLREPFHLSYPQVFRWCGRHVMVPESNEARAIRLYGTHRLPGPWRHEATLLRGHRFVDPSLFVHDGRWWMFVSDALDPVLNLYWAEAPVGPWHAHPANPVVVDDRRRSRPAGRVLVHDGQVVRFAQDDTDSYGRSVHAFAVTTLTTTAYAESELTGSPGLGPGGHAWNRAGMHHVDLVRSGAGWIAAVDGREY